jgi:hypothetical protein
MTEGEYKARIRAFGLTPYMPSYESATVHVDRDGHTHSIPDADGLTEAERVAFLEFLASLLGEN